MASYNKKLSVFQRSEDNEGLTLTIDEVDRRDGADTRTGRDQNDKRDGEGDDNTISSICRQFGEDLNFRNTIPFDIDLPFQKVRALNATTIIVAAPIGIKAAKVRVKVPENTKSVIITFGVKCFPKTWFDPYIMFPKDRVGRNAIVWQNALNKQTKLYKSCSMEIKLDYDIFLRGDAIIRTKNGSKYIVIELSEVF